MEQNSEQKNKGYRSYIIWAIIIVIALWLISWLLIWWFIGKTSDAGTFGDMFGAVNALFSGLAFAGLIITLLFQKEELGLQREELSQTRAELRNQRLEFEEQNSTLKRQRFENTFFNMLSLQQEILVGIHYRKHKSGLKKESGPYQYYVELSGRNVFEHVYVDIIKGLLTKGGIEGFVTFKEITNFDHYFRHLYRIIKFVDKSVLIEDNERYEYTSIVRAQLSDYELLMLFYNCLNYAGEEKFKPLLEKYAILKNIREELLVDESHLDLYNIGAYELQ